MTWIPEKTAAQLVQLHPRTLRRKVKNGAWSITYLAIEGRRFQYSKSDLDKFINQNAIKQ